MTDRFVRVTVRVPSEQGEEARAAALELAPEGFAESEAGGMLALALYVGEHRADSIRAVFAGAETAPVEPGWEDAWRAFHRPVSAGGVWIGPPWEQPPTGEPAVVIDPGRAFGTGAHPTTRVCVELLAAAPRGSLLDVGCGSGVLAIAAARLGFGPVVAVDDDPVAVEVTRANAHRQRRLSRGPRDRRTVRAAAPDGHRGREHPARRRRADPAENRRRAVITSGYLAGERPLAAGWTLLDSRTVGGWAADLFVRTAP